MSEMRIKRLCAGMKAQADWTKGVVDQVNAGQFDAANRRLVLTEIREALEVQREAVAAIIHLASEIANPDEEP